MLQQEERAPESIYYYLDHSAIWPPENMTEAKNKIVVKKEIRKYCQSFTTHLNKSRKIKNLNKNLFQDLWNKFLSFLPSVLKSYQEGDVTIKVKVWKL